MAACRSAIERKTPRRMRCRVIFEKKFSTELSQEAGRGEMEGPTRMTRPARPAPPPSRGQALGRLLARMRQTAAPGTRYFATMFDNQKQYWERLGDNLQWKNLRPTLHQRTVSIIERWREGYGNSPANFGFQARAESYLSLPCGTNAEPIAWTRAVKLVWIEIIVRPACRQLGRRSSRRLRLGAAHRYP